MSKNKKTTQTVTADPTTLARESQMWNAASKVAAQPFQAYDPNSRVAGMNDLMRQGASALPGAANAGMGAVGGAVNLAGAAGNYTPEMVMGQTAGPAAQANEAAIMEYLRTSGGAGPAAARDVSAIDGAAKMGQYMDPYTGQVVDASLEDMERQRQRAIMQGQAMKTAGGAYGGSRHGVSDALTNEAALRASGALSGQLRSQGFQMAAGLGMQDANRALQADMSNQGADVATSTANLNAGLTRAGTMANVGMFNAGQQNQMGMFNAGQLQNAQVANQGAGLTANAQRLGAAGTLGSLGQTQQNMGLQGADALYKGGQIEQNIEQAKRNAQFEEWQRKQMDPMQKLAFQQAFKGTPGQVNTNEQKGSALGGIIGGISTIAGGPLGGLISKGVSGLMGGAPAGLLGAASQIAPSVVTPQSQMPMRGIYNPITGSYE